MTPHDHRERVEGCYRCELGEDEAALPPIRKRDDDKHPIAYEDWNLQAFWRAAYRALDERQWTVLTERYIHEKSYAQIATHLDLSERHVRRLVDEAMDTTLREYQR